MIRRMEEIGWEVLANRLGPAGPEDVKVGFHWPIVTVGHLHLHVIAPASSMGIASRMIFSKMFFGDVPSAIELIESKEPEET